MKNQFKVVMLPTNEASSIYILPNKELCFSNLSMKGKKQHLYIVDTQAIINVNDYFHNPHSGHLHLAGSHSDITVINKNKCQKIIASTDNSLGLPNIPQEFIKAYVDNPNIIIDSVAFMNNTAICFKKSVEEKPQVEDLGRYHSLKHKQLDYEVVRLEKLLLKEMENGASKENCASYPEYSKAMKKLAIEVDKHYKPQVDFEWLLDSIEWIKQGKNLDEIYSNNLVLFFEMLGKSQSFAVKTHKELKNK